MAAATGPYDLEYPDGSKVTTQRGALMGLPTTWALLCLTHLFWVDEARHAVGRSRSGFARSPVREREVICGDDLSAWWGSDLVVTYEGLARECGAVFSPGKHLKSDRWGIFTEDCFSVHHQRKVVELPTPVVKEWVGPRRGIPYSLVAGGWTEGLDLSRRWLNLSVKPNRLEIRADTVRVPYVSTEPRKAEITVTTEFGAWSRSIPLRWAVKPPSRDPGELGPGVAGALPPWVTLGPAAHSVASIANRYAQVSRVLRILWPGLAQFLRGRGIPPFLCRALGGGGVPLRRGHAVRISRIASRVWRKALGWSLYRSHPPASFASLWG